MKETVEEIVPGKLTKIKSIDAAGNPMYITFLLDEVNGKSIVFWIYDAELKTMEKPFKFLMKKKMNESALLALNNLKKNVESQK